MRSRYSSLVHLPRVQEDPLDCELVRSESTMVVEQAVGAKEIVASEDCWSWRVQNAPTCIKSGDVNHGERPLMRREPRVGLAVDMIRQEKARLLATLSKPPRRRVGERPNGHPSQTPDNLDLPHL